MAAQPTPSSSSSRRSRTDAIVVGDFTIDKEIGKGSFATVFRAAHNVTGALVAVKSVNLSKLNKKLKENLYCEIEILKGLHHPHIVALIDCRESSSHIHLVMEYCELGDLSYFIKKRDKLADNPALRDMVQKYPMPPTAGLNEVVVRHFLKQLASAVEFLRERNFIHRDVKPQNLLILPSPTYLAKAKYKQPVMTSSSEALIPIAGVLSLPMLKIADFGFARSLPSTSLAETLCGSPLYMAPEILRYEKYDAKADLWSVGTVLYEMTTGKPPFRAQNHVDLLRKIEKENDNIRFPRDATVTAGMKDLIRGLLKRTPVERMAFEKFFKHQVVVEPIPGLVGEDRPQEVREPPLPASRTRASANSKSEAVPARRSSIRNDREHRSDEPRGYSVSPHTQPMPPSPRQQAATLAQQAVGSPSRPQSIPRPASREKRPAIPYSATAPSADTIQAGRIQAAIKDADSFDDNAQRPRSVQEDPERETIEEAEQAVRDAREYVLVEKRAVEVNAFADEMAANPRLQGTKQTVSQRTGQIVRRATTQGNPTSGTGAVPASPSRAVQIAQGRARPDVVPQRQDSLPRHFGSPSATSAIARALHGASVRVFGVNFSPQLITKGVSPPQLYNAFPAYPTPVGLIGDARPTGPIDEDQKAVNHIEESATRSDVVYSFAEVKYKQLIPMAPSMEHGLGGPVGEKPGESLEEDEGLTTEAIVALSEEALVLYVKALSLLAKSMDIAGAWWNRKARCEILPGGQIRAESVSSVSAGNRINSAVQWVRNRFNEVLEKAEIVRLKLIDAQKKLPEDHPGHPSNHTSASRVAGASSTDGVVLSSGITAEKLMYDRAIEMSRSAAINEIASEDLAGCEISYITAIRMLEAVLENDDEEPPPQRRRSSSIKDDKPKDEIDGAVNGIYLEDRQAVRKVVTMIRTRLSTLRKKMALIAKHQAAPSSPRPASLTHHSGRTTPIASTPPH